MQTARLVYLSVICFLAGQFSLFAAQEAPQQTLESLRPGKVAPGRPDQFTWPVSQNEDIGNIELVRKETPPPTLSVATAQSFFYTDNVLLTEANRIRSIGWNGWFNATLIPYSTFRWTPSIGLEQHLFRYNDSSSSDFDAQILTFASTLKLNEERTWSWTISYSLWRLYSVHGEDEEFYKQGELVNSLSWYRSLTEDGNLGLKLSTALAWRHVSPAQFDRVSAELGAGLVFYPLSTLEISPFVNVAARYYPTDTDAIHNRRDFTLQSGANVTWRPYKNFSIGCAFAWVGNYSNVDTLDYAVLLPFVGVGAQVSF